MMTDSWSEGLGLFRAVGPHPLLVDPRMLGPKKGSGRNWITYHVPGLLGLRKMRFDFDVEWAFDEESGEIDRRKIAAECPCCERSFAALLSPYTRLVGGGWRWVGIDHREPYSDYVTRCSKCKTVFLFTTFSPQ